MEYPISRGQHRVRSDGVVQVEIKGMDRSNQSTDPASAPAEKRVAERTEGLFTTLCVALAGFTALAGGVALAVGPEVSPELSWIARRLREAGITSGAVIGSGGLTCLLAFVAHRTSRVGSQMRSAEEAMKITQTLSFGMRQLVSRVTRTHAEIAEIKEGINGLLRVARDQTGTKVAGMQVDATYRLAASMDQMSMRIEDRIRAQETTFETRLTELFGSLSASHEQVQSLLDKRIDPFDGDDLLDSTPAPSPSPQREEPSSFDDDDFDREPRFPENAGDIDLEVFVDLDEDFHKRPEDGERPHVSEFDWDEIEVEPTIEGLGLLDELDDEGAAQGPMPLDNAPSLLRGSRDRSRFEPEPEPFSEEALERAWRDFKRRRDNA